MIEYVIRKPSSIEDLEHQWFLFQSLPLKIRLRTDEDALIEYGETNIRLYEKYKAEFNKNAETYVDIKDNQSIESTDSIMSEAVDIEKIIADGGFLDSDNVWNSILVLNNDHSKLYRGRVECLILRDNKIYLNKIGNSKYRVPGGSFERNISNIDQVANECKEEARILIDNIRDTKISYTQDIHSMPGWSKGKEFPVSWSARYTEVYVADYKGVYRGYVREIDKDTDMYTNGKFYDIDEVYDMLIPEHREALNSVLFDYIKESGEPNPVDNFTEQMYRVADEWSARSGYTIITMKDNVDDLDRAYIAYRNMSEQARYEADTQALAIFGMRNITLYRYIKSKLLKTDETDVDLSDMIADKNSDTISISSDITMESYKDSVNEQIFMRMEVLKSGKMNKNGCVFNIIDEMKDLSNTTTEMAIVDTFVDQLEYSEAISQEILPYFSPDDMLSLGVFDNNPEGNFYQVESSNKYRDWFDLYRTTGYPGDDWYKMVQQEYCQFLKDKSPANKQNLLELGWNPELPLSLDTILSRSSIIKERLSRADVIDISESNNIDDYTEVPYIKININKYELGKYLTETVDINQTNGRLFVNDNEEYVCHYSTQGDRIVGKGYNIGKKQLLDQILNK